MTTFEVLLWVAGIIWISELLINWPDEIRRARCRKYTEANALYWANKNKNVKLPQEGGE